LLLSIFALLKVSRRSEKRRKHWALDRPGIVSVTLSHLIAESFGKAFNADNKALSSPSIQSDPVTAFVLSSAAAVAALIWWYSDYYHLLVLILYLLLVILYPDLLQCCASRELLSPKISGSVVSQ
jgi:asparagine N-glycosylation enzyme membrane subunit Stt3